MKPQGLERPNNSPGSSKVCTVPCALSPSPGREQWLRQAVGYKTSTAGRSCRLGAEGSRWGWRKQRGGDPHPIVLLSILPQPVSIATGYLPLPTAPPAPDSHSQHHPPEAVGPKQRQPPYNPGACVGAEGSTCCWVEALGCAGTPQCGVHTPPPAATPLWKCMCIPNPAGFWNGQKLVRPLKAPGRFVFCPGSGIPPGLRHRCLLMEAGDAQKKMQPLLLGQGCTGAAMAGMELTAKFWGLSPISDPGGGRCASLGQEGYPS